MKILSPGSAYAPGQTPYDIFKDRMTAVSSIASGIKNIIANKYINKQNSMIAENIQNEIDKQKAIDLSNLIMSDPPDEIYPANLEDTVGAFVDKFAMGPMRKKEMMMGNLPAPEPELGPVAQKEMMTGGLPAARGITPTPSPTTETMLPKTDLYQLYNVIKDIPTGQMSWDNIYKKMTEKKPWFMGTTGPEEFVLNQMLGQVGDPRAKLASDINLSKLVKEAFYPEAAKPTEWDKKLDLFLQTEPTVDEVKKFVGGWIAPEKMSDFDKRLATFMLTEPTVPEMKKFLGGYIAPKTTGIEIQDIIANIPEGFELSSYNISTTGTSSFSFKPIDKTTAWEFDTWDEAQEFLRTHPQKGFIGKIETHDKGFDVTWYKETGEGGLKPITGSDIKTFERMLYGDEESPGVITPEDYEKVKDYIERSEKNFPIPGYIEIAEMNLSKCLNTDNSVLDMGLYKYFYEFYKNALKGKPPKYLPPNFIEKVGFFKNKYGSALADDYELDFEAMKKDDVTEEDVWKEIGGISP